MSGTSASSAVGSMSPLSLNINALLELPQEDQALAHITPETSGSIYNRTSSRLFMAYNQFTFIAFHKYVKYQCLVSSKFYLCSIKYASIWNVPTDN